MITCVTTDRNQPNTLFRARHLVLAFCLSCGALAAHAQSQIVLNFAPAQTTVEFTLDATFHTVHGTFNLKRGQVHYDPATGAVTGEIVADASSGHSGNDGRDNRMHREIIESAKYPEITFRPDRVEGQLAPHGTSTLQVHGIFKVHGTDHQISFPVQVEMAPDHWTAAAHFDIPYVKWGIKNPSNFFLHVSQSVTIDIHAAGMNPWSENAPK